MIQEYLDHFTPGGRMPEGGLGSLADLLGQLMRR
jgi:hypothetical protein